MLLSNAPREQHECLVKLELIPDDDRFEVATPDDPDPDVEERCLGKGLRFDSKHIRSYLELFMRDCSPLNFYRACYVCLFEKRAGEADQTMLTCISKRECSSAHDRGCNLPTAVFVLNATVQMYEEYMPLLRPA